MTIRISNIMNYNKFALNPKLNNNQFRSQSRGYIPISDYIGPLTEDVFVPSVQKAKK